MEPFFFGPDGQQCFAWYHPAATEREELTVICPPTFSDYMRTHHALREVAVALAERGQHVLRLDYRGTGDSAGDLAGIALTDWIDDVRSAVDEGMAISGASAVTLCGVRLGGLLAMAAAADRTEVRRVVLWDPPDSGRDYLAAARAIQAKMLTETTGLSASERQAAEAEVVGYSISKALREGIDGLRADELARDLAGAVEVVETTASRKSLGPSELVRFDCSWNSDTEDLLMPTPVLERIIARVVRRGTA